MLVERPAGQLTRRRLSVGARREIEYPNVLRMFRIDVAASVEAINGAGDDLYVTLVFRFGRGVFLLFLGNIFGSGVAKECNLLSVRRPYRIRRRTWQVSNRPRFA